jgi:hypothetical protein
MFLRNEENVHVAARELHCGWALRKKFLFSGPGNVDFAYNVI